MFKVRRATPHDKTCLSCYHSEVCRFWSAAQLPPGVHGIEHVEAHGYLMAKVCMYWRSREYYLELRKKAEEKSNG